ncbi:MAG: hypothetical protein ACLUSL_04920 [Ruminococcus sp.]
MQKKRGIRRGLTLLLAVFCAQTALALGGCASDAPEKTESGSTAVTTTEEDSRQSDTKKITTATATASKKTSTTQKTAAAASGSPVEKRSRRRSSSRNDAAPSGEQDAAHAGEAEKAQTPAGVQAEEGELPVLTDAAKNSGSSSKQTEPNTDAPAEKSVIELPFVPAE